MPRPGTGRAVPSASPPTRGERRSPCVVRRLSASRRPVGPDGSSPRWSGGGGRADEVGAGEPRAGAGRRPGRAHPDGPSSSGARSVDVLVVDDDHGVRTTVAEILRRARHTVAEAEDGQAALDRLEELRVGVLVVDVRMPRLNGVGLLRVLDDPPPAVVISAYSVAEEVRSSLGPKVTAYLRKPFKPEHLLAAVAGALGDGTAS